MLWHEWAGLTCPSCPHLPHINSLFPQLVVPIYKFFLHIYLCYSVRNTYTKFQPKFVGCGHAMTWMSRPHPSQLSCNWLLMRYAWIPTNHGPITMCDSLPCTLPSDGSVVTRTHALPSQSEFSDIQVVFGRSCSRRGRTNQFVYIPNVVYS